MIGLSGCFGPKHTCGGCPPTNLSMEIWFEDGHLVLTGLSTLFYIDVWHGEGGETTVFDFALDDPEQWEQLGTWLPDRCEDDPDGDCMVLPEAGEKGMSGYLVAGRVVPAAPGFHASTLTWWSDEPVGLDTEDGMMVNQWDLAVYAVDPCLRVWPEVLDFGEMTGESVTLDLTIERCVEVAHPLESMEVEGLRVLGKGEEPDGIEEPVLEPATSFPFLMDRRRHTQELTLHAEPGTTLVSSLVLTFGGGRTLEVPVFIGPCGEGGVPCDDPDWTDDDGDGLSEAEGDCDDTDASVHPGALELVGADDDDDCDGMNDEGTTRTDDDGDGYSEDEGDCDDTTPWFGPDNPDICDYRDNDCNGEVDEDQACDERR